MSQDAPDWQRVVNVVAGPAMTDAPDWERVVVGPGGTPVGGSGSTAATVLDFALDATWLQAVPASFCFTTGFPSGGQIGLSVMTCLESKSYTKVQFLVEAGGTGLVANQNFVGAYSWNPANGNLTRVATTSAGACDVPFATAQNLPYVISLAATFNAVAGTTYYAAILANIVPGSLPNFYANAYLSLNTPVTPAGAVLWGVTTATTYTSLPATILGTAITYGNNINPQGYMTVFSN